MTRKLQMRHRSFQEKEVYHHCTIRIRKELLASQSLAHHMQRFHSRYEAAWLAMLIEEFYVLLDGSDPRASLLYPLLYHRFEVSQPASTHPQEKEEGNEERENESLPSMEIQEMAVNLQGYFDEERLISSP